MNCKKCGKEFKPKSKVHKYCSVECRPVYRPPYKDPISVGTQRTGYVHPDVLEALKRHNVVDWNEFCR